MDSVAGKRLVIFGCGYLGTAVALEGMARGARVTALTRNSASAVVLREQAIETVTADLASEAWHDQIEGGADLALNCVSSGGSSLESYRHSYVDGMASILAWARRRGPARTLLYTSSTAVYPQGGGAVVDESAETAATGAAAKVGDRADVLLEAERLLWQNGGACARWFVLRLAGIYGPGRHHFVDQVRAGEASGLGENHLNLIHRDDAVSAIWACFTAAPGIANEIFNVTDNEPAPKAEIAAWIAAQLRLLPPHFTGEPWPGRRSVTLDRRIANTKLRQRLGWQPRYPTFREGCRLILESLSAAKRE